MSIRGSAANARAAAVMRPAAANAITAWMTKNGRTPASDWRSQRSAKLPPALAHRDVAQFEPPQQRRPVGKCRHLRVARRRDLRIVGRKRRGRIVRLDLKERAMPSEMHGKSGALDPRLLGLVEEREALAGAPLHLHHVGEDVDGAGMPGIDGERAPRQLFGLAILAVLLETERVHREHARVARHRGVPCGQRLRGAVPQHAALPEAKVERMGGREREHVVRPVNDDGAIAFGRERRVAVEPSARRVGVAARRIVRVRAISLDRSEARGEPRASGRGVGAHDGSGAQAVTRHVVRVLGQHAVDLGEGMAAMREQKRERMVATGLQIRRGIARGLRGKEMLARTW